MTSLHVICGLGPHNQKSWLRLWSLHCEFARDLSIMKGSALALAESSFIKKTSRFFQMLISCICTNNFLTGLTTKKFIFGMK